MSPNQEFNLLYKSVSENIAAAMKEISDLRVEHKDGKKELSNITQRLRSIQSRFDYELDLLEQHAEWDKFTMAFFGETNAGKSTLIESLRILFKEEAREQLLKQNAEDLLEFEKELFNHANNVREGIIGIYSGFAAEIVSMRQSVAALSRVQQEESSARIKIKIWLYALGGIFLGSTVVGLIAVLTGAWHG